MSESGYRPWRSGDEDTVVDADQTRQWSRLIEEAGRTLRELRAVNEDMENRLGLGARLLEALGAQQAGIQNETNLREAMQETIHERLDAFERRLVVMEEAVTTLAGQSRLWQADPDRPVSFQEVVKMLKRKAA